jgi:hypothetical protein
LNLNAVFGQAMLADFVPTNLSGKHCSTFFAGGKESKGSFASLARAWRLLSSSRPQKTIYPPLFSLFFFKGHRQKERFSGSEKFASDIRPCTYKSDGVM